MPRARMKERRSKADGDGRNDDRFGSLEFWGENAWGRNLRRGRPAVEGVPTLHKVRVVLVLAWVVVVY